MISYKDILRSISYGLPKTPTSTASVVFSVPLAYLSPRLFASPVLQQPLDVSHAQAGKLMLQAVALKGVYQKLLLGWSATVVFEEMAGLLAVGVSTVKQWEREYRHKGHIAVSSTTYRLSYLYF